MRKFVLAFGFGLLRYPIGGQGLCLSNGALVSTIRKQLIQKRQKFSPNRLSMTSPGMFCFQCEQTKKGVACSNDAEDIESGVCGKTPEVACLQDLLVHQMMGISQLATKLQSISDDSENTLIRRADHFIIKGLFSTLTNVNNDRGRFQAYLLEGKGIDDSLRQIYANTCKEKGIANEHILPLIDFEDNFSVLALVKLGEKSGVLHRKAIASSIDAWGIGELCLYGLKGMAAYAEHARCLGQEDSSVYASLHKYLDFLADLPNRSEEELLSLALNIGATNFRVMELLDYGHTERYGHPTPTKVLTSHKKGKAILVSGHDIRDLEEVLIRTSGTGINVYTHGELLPAHGYPGLHKYPHLAGNYGGAWQMQKIEFAKFPGPVLVTTNCMIEPMKSYKDRLYTRHTVGWEDVKHISDFTGFDALVKHALQLEGFENDALQETSITVGFGRNAVLELADKVLEAVSSGDIKHFFVVGGCDGSEAQRSYFKDIAENAPRDAVVMTMGCGKYRFNKTPFETTLGGLPRLLDVGQCNDAYSAIQIASALAKALHTDVNGLPIHFAISWFEQKAVAVLLTMLHLNIKNIHLGPKLPAFVTPKVLTILNEGFGLTPVDHDKAQKDLQKFITL